MALSRLPVELRGEVFRFLDRDQIDTCELVHSSWLGLLRALAGVLPLLGLEEFKLETVCAPLTIVRFTRVTRGSSGSTTDNRRIAHFPFWDRKRILSSFRFLHRCYVDHLRIDGKLVDPTTLVMLRNRLEGGTTIVNRLSFSRINSEYECLANLVLMQFPCVNELSVEEHNTADKLNSKNSVILAV